MAVSSAAHSDADTEPLYEHQFAEAPEGRAAYGDLAAVVRRLRRDCPWDRAQTHASVRHLLIEEAYEVVEAIDEADEAALKEELGDVLLHVLFHSAIAEEEGRFTLREVVEAETEKLVRRHPHVFGEAEADDAEAVAATWEQVKQQERAEEEDGPSVLGGVPRALPALLRAYRVQQKAAGVGFDFPEDEGAWDKVEEEIAEFRALADASDAEEAEAGAREAEFGDVLFALVNYARRTGINPENALRRTNDTFARRFAHIEQQLAAEGRSPAEADLEEMDRLWEEAKRLEKERAGERGSG